MERVLYVTDMDGTLLGADSLMSRRSARIITELSWRGVLITVATARTPATVEPLLKDTYTALPAIVMTGASLWDRQHGRYKAPMYIPCLTIGEIERLASEYGINLFRYTLGSDGVLDVFHCGEMSEKERIFVDERSSLTFKRFHLDDRCEPERATVLFFAMGERERIFALGDELRRSVDCSVSCYVDIFGKDTGILEVFAPGVSKAAAVKRLACEVNAGRVVVFGDNLNDIPMMQVADEAVAVANALPEVKSVADVVIGCNAEDAVAEFILQRSGIK